MNVNPKKVKLSDHAFNRLHERFGIKSMEQAIGTVRQWLHFAEFVAEVTDEENDKPALLFAYKGTSIYLSTDLTTVLTVVQKEANIYNPLRKQLIQLHKKKLNHFTIKERAAQRKMELFELEANAEISQLKLRMHKTRSSAVKSSCLSRINEVNFKLDEWRRELDCCKSEKRKVAKSMANIL